MIELWSGRRVGNEVGEDTMIAIRRNGNQRMERVANISVSLRTQYVVKGVLIIV